MSMSRRPVSHRRTRALGVSLIVVSLLGVGSGMTSVAAETSGSEVEVAQSAQSGLLPGSEQSAASEAPHADDEASEPTGGPQISQVAQRTTPGSGVWESVGRSVSWSLDDKGVLTLGSGDLPEYLGGAAPWGLKRDITKIVFTDPSHTKLPANSFNFFAFMWSLEEIVGIEDLDASEMVDASNLFADNYSLKNSLNLSGWKTPKLKIAQRMFSGASALTQLNVANWDVTGVTSLLATFEGMKSLKSLDLSTWDTRNVVNMERIFSGNVNLESLRLDNKWSTSSVTNMGSMFESDSSLKSVADVSKFDVRKVESMRSMFYGTSAVKSIDIRQWKTDSLLDCDYMFGGMTGLTTIDVSALDVSKVKGIGNVFIGDSGITSLDVSMWNMEDVEQAIGVFSGMSSLRELNLKGWEKAKFNSISRLFTGTALTSLDLSSWDASQLTFAIGTFKDTASLRKLNLTGWKPARLFRAWEMFAGAGVTSLELSGWKLKQPQYMYSMFEGATGLTSLDLSDWNTDALLEAQNMFAGASSLTSVNLSGWDTSSGFDMTDMFAGAPIEQLVLSDTTVLDQTTGLRQAPTASPYTGSWVQAGAGTARIPQGPWSGDTDALFAQIASSSGSDTYVLQKEVEVTLNSNTTTPDTVTVRGVTGKQIALPVNTFSRAQYTFVDWNTAADLSGTAYANRASAFFPAGAMTLYARWNIVPAGVATISFDGNGATSGAMPDLSGDVGDTVSLPAVSFSRADHTFAGWNTEAGGGGVSYADKASVVIPAAGLTLYAQWDAEMGPVRPSASPTATVSPSPQPTRLATVTPKPAPSDSPAASPSSSASSKASPSSSASPKGGKGGLAKSGASSVFLLMATAGGLLVLGGLALGKRRGVTSPK